MRQNPKALWDVNEAGETLLHWAALTNNDKAMLEFLNLAGDKAADLAKQTTYQGLDATMLTAAQNAAATLKVLLKHPQAKVNLAATQSYGGQENGLTALHIATGMGHSDIALQLIPRVSKEILNSATRPDGHTPAMNAAMNGLHRTIEAMFKRPDFDPSPQSATSQDAAAYAARYGDEKGDWHPFIQFMKAKLAGKNITFNARDYSGNHTTWQELSALAYAAKSAPQEVFRQAVAFADSNVNQSLFSRAFGPHEFTTLMGIVAQYNRPDNLAVLADIMDTKLRLKTEYTGDDAMKIAVKYKQKGMIGPLDEAIRSRGKQFKAMKRNRYGQTLVRMGYDNGALDEIAVVKKVMPKVETRPTSRDLDAADRNLSEEKFTAWKSFVRRTHR